MKLYVREPERKEYHRQLYNCPSLLSKSEIRPGDTLYGLAANYYIDKVEYSISDVTVYATKMASVTRGNQYGAR